jgi:hypothetical protein
LLTFAFFKALACFSETERVVLSMAFWVALTEYFPTCFVTGITFTLDAVAASACGIDPQMSCGTISSFVLLSYFPGIQNMQEIILGKHGDT